MKTRSIFQKTFVPIFIMVLVILLVISGFEYGYTLRSLRENAYDVFAEQTQGRYAFLENKMTGQWSAIQNNAGQITELIKNTAKSQRKRLDELKTDPELNCKILENTADIMVEMVKGKGISASFLIINGPVNKNNQEIQAGLCFFNDSPDFYSSKNRNLFYEIGISSISKKQNIPLAANWQTGFMLDEEKSDYYYKPFMAAQNADSTDSSLYGYWDYTCLIPNSNEEMLTYSVPLIAEDGSILGVLGIGIKEEHLLANMQGHSSQHDYDREYMLARLMDGKVETIAYTGNSSDLKELQQKDVYKDGEVIQDIIELEGEEKVCASIQELNLYSNNVMFEDEKWLFFGMENKSTILHSFFTALEVQTILFVVSMLLGVLCVWLVSHSIAKPMEQLIYELRHSNVYHKISLKKTHIVEVDELVDSIENLSERVAKANSIISEILKLTEAGVEVFEYKSEANLVFCSENFYPKMGWKQENYQQEYHDATDFIKRIEDCLGKEAFFHNHRVEVVWEDASTHWMDVSVRMNDEGVLGVITDVTREVLEKQKIEFERDNDVLTHLMNRRAYEEHLTDIFAGERNFAAAGVLAWDLDNLKYFNDTYGHHCGDTYIVSFANCLKQMNGANVVSARRSGDEFMTFITGESRSEIETIIRQIWSTAAKVEMELPNGGTTGIRVSMGVSWYPSDALDYQTLARYADFALYEVKHNRKGTYTSFDISKYQNDSMLLQGHEALNHLLERKMVDYAMQPILRRDGSVYGYEMLMRPSVKIFENPTDLLRMAREQSRLYEIEALTWFESMRIYQAQMEKIGQHKDTKVFINSLANQLMSENDFERFEEKYADYLGNIVCEITEEERMDDNHFTKKRQYLNKWNGMMALDDYGCGYNGDAILLQVSPDIIKIDITLVKDVHKDENRGNLIKKIIAYARENNALVLGEGIECREEMEELMDLGVDLLQGFYLGKPLCEIQPIEEHVLEELRQANAKSAE